MTEGRFIGKIGSLMQHGCVEAESLTHHCYNSFTKPKFYKNTRLVGKIIEKTSITKWVGSDFCWHLLHRCNHNGTLLVEFE